MAGVSVVSQGPGWWLASDGRWYPPHLHPDYRLPPPPPSPWPAPGTIATAPPDGGPLPHLWPSLALLIGGGICGAAGIVVFFVVGLAGLLNATVYATPAHVTVQCH